MYTIAISKPPPIARPSMAATEGLSAAETQSKQSNTQHLSSLKKIQLYIYIYIYIYTHTRTFENVSNNLYGEKARPFFFLDWKYITQTSLHETREYYYIYGGENGNFWRGFGC
jgi:hypothetical protein